MKYYFWNCILVYLLFSGLSLTLKQTIGNFSCDRYQGNTAEVVILGTFTWWSVESIELLSLEMGGRDGGSLRRAEGRRGAWLGSREEDTQRHDIVIEQVALLPFWIPIITEQHACVFETPLGL